MSSYVLIDFEAAWTGEGDPRAVMIGVIAEVDERPFTAQIDERHYTISVDENDMLVAGVSLPVYKARSEQPPSPIAVVDESVGAIAVVDEVGYGAVVTIPANPVAKVDEWPL